MAFDNPLAADIWSSKYRFKPAEGAGDDTVEQTWARVAAAQTRGRSFGNMIWTFKVNARGVRDMTLF